MSTDSTTPESRSQRKERTRAAIFDTALILCEDEPLAALSLRAIAKEVGIVPTAFYRHFESIEDLGLALVDRAMAVLRELLREIRQACTDSDDPIKVSIDTLITNFTSHPRIYGFVVRERVAGPPRVREAMCHGLELVTRELATDLARLPRCRTWSTEDLTALAALLIEQALKMCMKSSLKENSPRTRYSPRYQKQAIWMKGTKYSTLR